MTERFKDNDYIDEHQHQAFIGAMLYELSGYWRDHPQQRFGQVLENILGKCVTYEGCLWNISDTEWWEKIRKRNDKDQ